MVSSMRQTSSCTFVYDCGWNDQARKAGSFQLLESHILSLGGVLWSHVEGSPRMYKIHVSRLREWLSWSSQCLQLA